LKKSFLSWSWVSYLLQNCCTDLFWTIMFWRENKWNRKNTDYVENKHYFVQQKFSDQKIVKWVMFLQSHPTIRDNIQTLFNRLIVQHVSTLKWILFRYQWNKLLKCFSQFQKWINLFKLKCLLSFLRKFFLPIRWDKVVLSKIVLSNFCPKQANELIGAFVFWII
jgi:hypothetical protein